MRRRPPRSTLFPYTTLFRSVGELPRYLTDVLAAVESLGVGDGPLLVVKLGVAGGDRLAEEPDLVPPVIEVALARDDPAGGFEYSGQRVPVGRVPPVSHGEWSCRVGAHELDLDRLSRRFSPTVPLALGEQRLNLCPEQLRREPEVDEARTRDLGLPYERHV